ncbi:DUF3289 family protein [Erwinia sp. CPCC 100877]|nr:DUF3289 family protein [Erwinia sp. CPCC 100877]
MPERKVFRYENPAEARSGRQQGKVLSGGFQTHGRGEKIIRQQCAAMLFDEFRSLSRTFSLYGPYSHLVEKMMPHMQNGNGTPFQEMALDRTLKDHIIRDNSQENSTRLLLKEGFNTYLDWENKCFPAGKEDRLRKVILDGKLILPT